MSLLPESNTKFSASVMVLWGHLKQGRRHASPTSLRWDRGGQHQAVHRGPWHPDEALDGDCCWRMSLRVPAGQSPAHTTKITQACLKVNLKHHCPKEIWPPSSLDWNPLEYFMWSEFEREVSKYTHNTLASLNAKILVLMVKIDREVVIPACKKV